MLKAKSLTKIFFILLIVSGIIWGVARKDAFKSLALQEQSNTIFVPGLIEKLVTVDKIILQTFNNELEFIKKDDSWQLTNEYPINKRLVNNLLLELCNLKLLDKKTSNPDKLEQLQLSGDNSIKLILQSQDGLQNVVELIIGKSTNLTIGDESTAKTFVRHANSNQSFLVLGNISISMELQSWIEQPLSPLGSSKNIHKVTIFNEKQQPSIFVRASHEASFALINADHNFNHISLNNFLSDFLALEFQDVVLKPVEILKSKNVLGFANPQAFNAALSADSEKDIKIVIETFDHIQYTFQIKAFGERVMAQIESNFVRQFPNDYPLIFKPLQQTLVTSPIREQYIFKLSKKEFDLINSAQKDILNG